MRFVGWPPFEHRWPRRLIWKEATVFEHLDDPSSPEPTAHDLAVVFARSAARAKRRATARFGVLGVGILVLGLAIGLLVPRSPTSVGVTNLALHAGALTPGLNVPGSDLTGVVFPDDQEGFALTIGSDATALAKTTDAGQTWQVVDGDLPVDSEAQLDFTNVTDGYLWGGSPRGDGSLPLWITSNGGQ